MARLAWCAWLLLASAGHAAADFQARANDAKWQWEPGHASVLYSLTQASRDYAVEVIRKRNSLGDLTIRVLDGDKVLYSFDGHPGTVFAIDGGVLYYAEFHPDTSGCTVVARDLKAGKQLWKTPLAALGPVKHSKYSNRVTLEVGDGVLEIHGMETLGNYLEYVDLKTGKTAGHRVFKK